MSTADGYAAPRPGFSPGGANNDREMPREFSRHALRKRLLILLGVIVAVIALITLLPGLSNLRSRFAHAAPGWIALGVGLKLLSGLSYVVIFRAVFCSRMKWRHSLEIGLSELGANALFPTGGAGGLALGAWALRRGGMPASRIARRTVAFFFLTSVPNVVGVFILGICLAAGAFGGRHLSLALTIVPAAAAFLAFVGTIWLGRLATRRHNRLSESRAGSKRVAALGAIGDGINETLVLLREHNYQLVAGAIGYLTFDVFILWATFHAFGSAPALSIIWIGYLIGELGGLIPVPGGIGGVDLGLVGSLVLYGVSATSATAAVLAYRAIALWVPSTVGSGAFVALRRTLRTEAEQLAACGPGDVVDTINGPVIARAVASGS